MFDEDGLGNYGTEAARPRQPGEGGDEMDEKYQEIAHVQHGSKKLKTRGNPGKLAIRHKHLPFFLEIQVQNRRKPLRCQPMTVSGLTSTKAFRQFGQVHKSQTQNPRSVARSRGRGHCLFITASCRRRTRFSKAISRTW